MDIVVGRAAGRSIALVVVLLLIAGLVSGTTTAEAAGTNCPAAVPTDTLTRGMTATGYTVSEGTDPDPFDVEILGVLRNALAPGKHLIVVDTSSPAIEEAGGIWAGMSGSPIYIGDDLVGAIAYGFSWGPSSIAGVTPAEDMLEILDYPSGSAAPERSFAPGRRTVAIPRGMARRIADREGVSASTTQNFRRLAVPMAISGVDAARYEILNQAFARSKAPFFATPGGSATPAPVTEPLEGGDSLAAAYSFGDVTYAAVGTATLVCDAQIVGFGHPFTFGGPTELGAAGADALAVIDDHTYGPYKLANVTGIAGIVDQDRLSGIRVDTSEGPELIPITSDVSFPEESRSRSGQTDSVTSEFLPFIAATHVFGSIDGIFDQIGEGSADISWTVHGTREDDSTFEFTRTNVFTSRWDIAIDAVWEMLAFLDTMYQNEYEDIEFTDLDVDVSLTDEYSRYKVKQVFVSQNGLDYFKQRYMPLRTNKKFYVRVFLAPSDGGDPVQVDMTMKTPESFKRGGILRIFGPGSGHGDFCFGGCGGDSDETFDALLSKLGDLPSNDSLVAQLLVGRRRQTVVSEVITVLDRVVVGEKTVFVFPAETGGGVSGSPGSG